jgi:hypothetical protein
MKKFLFALLLLVFVLQTFSQSDKGSTLSKDYYLQKSKNKNTIGWILLGGGTAMIVGGAIFYPKRESPPSYSSFSSAFSSFSEAFTLNANDIIILIGTGADIISIPFFISAHKNKKRAASVAITNQKILWYQKNNVGFVTQPSVTIKFGL